MLVREVVVRRSDRIVIVFVVVVRSDDRIVIVLVVVVRSIGNGMC